MALKVNVNSQSGKTSKVVDRNSMVDKHKLNGGEALRGPSLDENETQEPSSNFMPRKGLYIDMGIEEKNRKIIVDGLSRLLADSFTLNLRTLNFHWNITGPLFQTLHLMFESQYGDLTAAVDLIAERIRALGFLTPATYAEFAELTTLKEERGVSSSGDMIKSLCDGQEAVARTAREIWPAASKFNDMVTLDLLTQRMQSHEKTAWQLRSLLS